MIDKRALYRKREELNRKPIIPPSKEAKVLAEKLTEKAKQDIEERQKDVRRNIEAASLEGADELVSIKKGRITILPSLNEEFKKNYEKINWHRK